MHSYSYTTTYIYDKANQLVSSTTDGKDLERYTYDPAGNRLSKTINGLTTTYTYDKANQLVTSTVNGVTTHYKYDAAGRMIQAGDKKYIYNGQNKVAEVRQNGKTIARFEYNIDGQIAKAIYGDKVEEFMWDGLALIWRSGVTYINEPYVTGGNPVMAGDDVLFNDMLGSTLAINGKAVEMTSFGETADKNAFFTGKPMIDELGYSFLFRDYNPNQGKWTTSDPLGYPDGWNNLAYVNNEVIGAVDICGTFIEGKVQAAAQAAIDSYINAQALNALLNSLSSGSADKDLELKGNFNLVISGIKIEYQVKNFLGTDNESTTLGNQNKSLELSSTLIRTDPNVYNKRNPSGDSAGPAADVSLKENTINLSNLDVSQTQLGTTVTVTSLQFTFALTGKATSTWRSFIKE